MKQSDDQRTIDMVLEETPTRKRGRPRKDDALSDAERARRYRARQKILPRGEWNYEQVTATARAEIVRMLAEAGTRPAGEAELMTQWAYGMFLLWDRVSAQCQRAEDRRELQALVSA